MLWFELTMPTLVFIKYDNVLWAKVDKLGDVYIVNTSSEITQASIDRWWRWYCNQGFSNWFLAATQAALWMVLSVRPSVRLSHLFHYVPVIISSWNFQELLPWTKVASMQNSKSQFKGHGYTGQSKFCPNLDFPDHTSSLNSQMAAKWCA